MKDKKKIKKFEKDFKLNEEKIKILHDKNNDLQDQINLASNYKEGVETWKEGRKKVSKLIGRRHWKEGFRDESSGKIIFIERSAICRIDGKPCDQFGNLFQYYRKNGIKK